MSERRMACWNCPRYDRTERKCKDGKTNPKRKADSVLAAELLGVRALCHYNPYRDLIALLTYAPKTPAVIALAAKSRRTKRTRRGTIPVPVEESPKDMPPS